ncbi:MAG: M1 family aminopeptidase [Salinivirgaceae bacterium]
MIKKYALSRLLAVVPFLLLLVSHANSQSGGVLSPNQAAYDVTFYDLELAFDFETKTIDGSLLCRARVLDPIDSLEMDLIMNYSVDSVLCAVNADSLARVEFRHESGKIMIDIPEAGTEDDWVTAKVFYRGAPPRPSGLPWASGFNWNEYPNGSRSVGVACEGDGADVWWPCKDHPSDEPDSVALSFTVPQPLECVSNGVFIDSVHHADSTATFRWFVSSPINNYNVTFYIDEFIKIEDKYYSVIGDSIPFYFWVRPSHYDRAIDMMDVFEAEFNFLESIGGPYPFGHEKHGFAHSRYWGMEHQTIIAYGSDFSVETWGFDYIHLHELAHEWWGNLITAENWADVWIHEGIATYTEALYVEHISGMQRYLAYMRGLFPANSSVPLAPRQELTADEALFDLNPYRRGASVMHTLRYHLGDEQFFSVLKHWAYPDTTDYDNTNGRQCRMVTTDDLLAQTEEITGREMDAFFEVFFREGNHPRIFYTRNESEIVFEWRTETDVPLDLNIPVVANGVEYTVEMVDGFGSLPVQGDASLEIDPNRWLLDGAPQEIVGLSQHLNAKGYRLEQNYPNPVENETTIELTIPEYEHVSLKIYNSLGREVLSVFDQKLTPNTYEVAVDLTQLEPGIYYYTLQVHEFSETKRLMVR